MTRCLMAGMRKDAVQRARVTSLAHASPPSYMTHCTAQAAVAAAAVAYLAPGSATPRPYSRQARSIPEHYAQLPSTHVEGSVQSNLSGSIPRAAFAAAAHLAAAAAFSNVPRNTVGSNQMSTLTDRIAYMSRVPSPTQLVQTPQSVRHSDSNLYLATMNVGAPVTRWSMVPNNEIHFDRGLIEQPPYRCAEWYQWPTLRQAYPHQISQPTQGSWEGPIHTGVNPGYVPASSVRLRGVALSQDTPPQYSGAQPIAVPPASSSLSRPDSSCPHSSMQEHPSPNHLTVFEAVQHWLIGAERRSAMNRSSLPTEYEQWARQMLRGASSLLQRLNADRYAWRRRQHTLEWSRNAEDDGDSDEEGSNEEWLLCDWQAIELCPDRRGTAASQTPDTTHTVFVDLDESDCEKLILCGQIPLSILFELMLLLHPREDATTQRPPHPHPSLSDSVRCCESLVARIRGSEIVEQNWHIGEESRCVKTEQVETDGKDRSAQLHRRKLLEKMIQLLKNLRLDQLEWSCLKALTLLQPTALEEPKCRPVALLADTVRTTLIKHCADRSMRQGIRLSTPQTHIYRIGSFISRFFHVLTLLTEMRTHEAAQANRNMETFPSDASHQNRGQLPVRHASNFFD
ncbi:unnamed protein product [Dicrocoelium dendriticum]|nr:unnamed protein product [Dicrocoelium dendriticum]